jgi:hypothetical protein
MKTILEGAICILMKFLKEFWWLIPIYILSLFLDVKSWSDFEKMVLLITILAMAGGHVLDKIMKSIQSIEYDIEKIRKNFEYDDAENEVIDVEK